jgi:hypothetical protein
MTAAIISSVDPARSGTASAVLNAARQVGGAGYANETERFPKTENCFLQRKEPDSFVDMLYLLSVVTQTADADQRYDD